MSGYKKNYTSWTKGNLNPSTYSGNSSSKIETSLKYGSVYSRPTVESKSSSDRNPSLRLGQKYSSYNSPHYCDPVHSKDSEKYAGTTVTARLKETDKREPSQPPVSYRSIARPGTRSRDPSMERDTTDRLSSLSIHNCNSLYPPSIHTRSVSHDRSESTTSTSTIPKYTGRSSITKTDKFGLTRTSRNESKEDLSTTKYKPLSRATSREDLDSGPKKYITSRFLPKNTIEKSHTAYIRPSSTRISSSQRDTSRKNREILNLLSAQTDNNKTSRSTSRSSNLSEPSPSAAEKTSTSSTTTSTGVTKSEKVTSDNTSDSTKSKISNTSATPWSSYLDLKFSSPRSSKNSSQNQSRQSTSSNKLPISNSSKSTSHNQSDSKLKLSKSPSHSLGKSILNKDFRKSVLNMNPDTKKCHHNGSVSPEESETEFPLSEATDVSENLSSCVSYHKQSSSSVSKLPMRSNVENIDRRSGRSNTRSPSIPSEGHSNATTATSGSEDDLKTKSTTPKSEIKQNKSFLSSRSFLLNEHGDGSEKSPKPPMSPRLKSEKSDVDPKSLLVRTLLPATGFIKLKHQDSDHRINWMDSTDKETSNSSSKVSKSVKEESKSDNIPKIKIMRRVDSGERAWWLDDNVTPPEGVQVYQENSLDKSQESQKDYFQKYHIRPIDSGDKAWWLNSDENSSANLQSAKNEPKYKISHQTSGEKAWWLQTPPKSNAHSSESDLEDSHDLPLGDRASPEGLEMPREEEERIVYSKVKKPSSLFISKHKNIDDILGGASQCLSPLMEQIFNYQERKPSVEDCQEVQPDQVKIHDSTAQRGIIHPNRLDNVSLSSPSSQADRLDDASLQLYKDGDYGSYLDLEASISEQHEEFEGFQLNKKNSIVLRTQLSVRVHSIIDKLLNSEGRELRRALFSLKQIFQEDKDLVHEFVQNDGLACLIKVGSEADQNYQNYILRALGQVMLYVDGMNGVIHHNETVQWLYSLISSKFRLVVKTALKLLLVFVEYVDSNCLLLIKAVQNADCLQGLLPWHNIMKLLKDFDSADTELLIYAMTLINKSFNGIPDQDTYYDQTDALEEQGIEGIIQRYMSKPGTDLDLLQQFQVYEAVLQYEDAEEKGIPLRNLDENLRKTLKSRKSVMGCERRKSRRHSTGTSPLHASLNLRNNSVLQVNAEGDDESSSSQSSTGPNEVHLNGSYKENNKASEAGVTPALRRRRERAERQRSFMREQQETAAILREAAPSDTNNETINGNYINPQHSKIPNGKLLNRTSSRKDITPLKNAVNKLDSDDSNLTKQPWILSMMYGNKTVDDENQENIEDTNENDRKMLMNRENTVKDLTQKLANQTSINNNFDDNKINRIGDMSGLISKAKEGLAKSKSKIDVLKSPTNENVPKLEIKKSENELRWEELAKILNRPLHLCDMDFTDLLTDDEIDVLAPAAASNGIPPPPPPLMGGILAPPPPPLNNNNINNKTTVPSPPVFGVNLQRVSKPVESKLPIKKNKKTVKLFWKEVRDDAITAMKLKTGLIWDELLPVSVDTQKLEHLFESRAKDLITKKQQELNKNKEIIVLDPKRSNAINIGMTKLPPPRSIKTAILKMDATVMNREGIEKLLTMLPTEEERTKIQEAQAAHPDLPLGSAEQFLLTLASISELPARLNLWAFKLDFESSEREIAEPLMDLKQGFEVLRVNKTFRGILGTLLSIGMFLNGAEVKGFQIEYLAKVPEVKDTVHKHSLLHHLCHIVMEKFPDASDLYSEIGAITRASKVDFDELALNIQRLETDCKASWDHLKLIAKHDGSTMMKGKMSDFLADCAERIILLGIVHRRVMNRFHRFLLWLGIPLHQIADTKPNEFCRVISEFSLEYRTTRERVLQQLEKKANHRERNKTRGKMITEIGKFRTKEDRADAELRQLLGSDMSDAETLQGTFTWRRRSRDTNRSFLSQGNGNLTDGDDEILESLVKTATKGPSRTAPRERKRTRHADRKSLKRSRTRENNPFGSRDSP